jgi:hypothetical protein
MPHFALAAAARQDVGLGLTEGALESGVHRFAERAVDNDAQLAARVDALVARRCVAAVLQGLRLAALLIKSAPTSSGLAGTTTTESGNLTGRGGINNAVAVHEGVLELASTGGGDHHFGFPGHWRHAGEPNG